MRDFGANSIVGSICPKIPRGEPTDPSFGYNPVLEQLVDRVHVSQTSRCFKDKLKLNNKGALACALIEARHQEGGSLDCSNVGRANVSDTMREAATKQLMLDGECGGDSGIDCAEFNTCALLELAGDARDACLHDTAETSLLPAGFCYIDPELTDKDTNGDTIYVAGGGDNGRNELVETCAPHKRRMIRFTGTSTPATGALAFVVCDSALLAD